MKSLFVVVPMLFAGALCAQGQGRRATSLTPARIAQNETDRLTRFFSLTPVQQGSTVSILTAADMQIQTIQTQIQPLRSALMTAIKANNPSQIHSTLLQISPLQEQVESIRAVAAGQIYATVLDSSQQSRIPNGLGPLLGDGAGVRFRER